MSSLCPSVSLILEICFYCARLIRSGPARENFPTLGPGWKSIMHRGHRRRHRGTSELHLTSQPPTPEREIQLETGRENKLKYGCYGGLQQTKENLLRGSQSLLHDTRGERGLRNWKKCAKNIYKKKYFRMLMLRLRRGRSRGEKLWPRTYWPMTHQAPLRTSPGSCPGSSPRWGWRRLRSILRVSGRWCPPTTTTSSWRRWAPGPWAPTWSSGPESTSASSRWCQECCQYVSQKVNVTMSLWV